VGSGTALRGSSRNRGTASSGEDQIWEKGDLIRRVSQVLDFATQVVQSLLADDWAEAFGNANGSPEVFHEKIIAETAMLLFCTATVQAVIVNDELVDHLRRLAALLVPLARTDSLLSRLCANPRLASNGLVAHAVVSKLGHPDALIDRLLRESKALDNRFGAEKLPSLLLEQEWLARVWDGCAKVQPERGLLGRSILGRPMDVLGCTRFDVYSFTHAIMFSTDFGGRRTNLPRTSSAIATDADAALALSLDIDDLDVTAELSMTWPMLALRWSAPAIFAFGIMTKVHTRLGFLPGPTFEPNSYASSTGNEQSRHVFATCYHTTYVMGMLCAACLREGCSPPQAVPAAGTPGSGPAVARLLDSTAEHSSWRTAFNALSPRQQDSLAPLILTIVLRRAKDRGDLAGLRACLDLALRHRLVEGPSVRQAVALLRRSGLLSTILEKRSAAAEVWATH
jgi:hypothetical protein